MILAALAVTAGAARAEHEHHHHDAPADDMVFTATVGALAASYRARLYRGDYQGGSLGIAWAKDRFEVAVRGSAYQIDRNGKTYRGLGDLMVHGAARLVDRGRLSAGGHVMVMVPTGDAASGLGMGHWMVMPAAWASVAMHAVVVSGAIGYARGLGGEDEHAEHGGGGAWPLVEPMSFSEITFDATAMVPVADTLAVGVRALGALPTGGDDARAVGAARLAWRAGRVETLVEAQAGITGDPVRFRGLVATSLTF